MDVALPVWTIRPNWKAGVLERLEWLTDVLTSETGVEQRRSVRQSPRRSFEITVNPTNAERTYLDLVMHRLGSNEWLFPLWQDQGVLGAATGIGTESLEIDTTFREFRDGDYALLFQDTFTWEVVSIAEVLPGSLHLAGGPEQSWPRGTKVYPLRRATVQTDTQISALTSRVGQSVLLFQVNEANDYAEAIPAGTIMYQGAPLIDREPNRKQEITLSHTRLFSEQDGEIGLRYRTDDAGRAFAAQSHNWMIQGRKDQAQFRSLLYYLRGQQRMVWLPSFNDDLFISRPIAAGSNRATIRKVGIGYVGGPIPGRARFWTGKEVVLHASMVAAPTIDEERLALTAGTTYAYTADDAWSFLEPARLNSDTIEIMHHTDSDGTCEISTAFKTFANDRVAAMPIALDPPQGIMNSALCGEPGDAALNPCYVPPSDVRMTIQLAPTQFYCNPAWNGNQDIRIQRTQPNGPGGKIIEQIPLSGSGGPVPLTTVYEVNIPGHPFLGGQALYDYQKTTFNDYLIRLYFDPTPGEMYFHQFPAARYCSSGGGPKDEYGYGQSTVTITRPDQPVLVLGPFQVGGNTDTYWRWMA